MAVLVTLRDRTSTIALVLLFLFASITPASAEEGPLPQDDAGSGKDAPDGFRQEISILPGIVYAGSSPGPTWDHADVYHLNGTAGQTFEGWADGNAGCYRLFNATGRLLMGACSYLDAPANSGPIVYDLPYTGDYYFRVEHLAPADYRFAFAFDGPPPDVRTVSVDGDPVPQDDAGSGRDAPDDLTRDIRIRPDIVYEGTSTGRHTDAYDTYYLNGSAGQVFRGWADGNVGCYELIDAQNDSIDAYACSYVHAPSNTGPIHVVLPHTGDYFFRVQHSAPAYYRFGFSLDGAEPEVRLVPWNDVQDSVQDDAGSGRDAPDDLIKGIRIHPDVVYEGNSTGPIIDGHDTYYLNGSAGQIFRGWADGNVGCYELIDAQNDSIDAFGCSYAHTRFNSGPIHVVLPHTGDYFFRVEHVAPSYYRFGFSLDGPEPELGLLPWDQLGDPMQNDAGSGRDAPGRINKEITVEPDVVYEGSAAGYPLDLLDVYHLNGTAGEVFESRSDGHEGCYRLLDTDGTPLRSDCGFTRTALGPESLFLELPYSGDYYLMVESTVASAYRFAFTLNHTLPEVRLYPAATDAKPQHGDATPLPEGCTSHRDEGYDPVCYYMRTDLNVLDTPDIDVLILPPASPSAERDLRVMRQAVEMWAEGIDTLAPQMGLDWLSDGVDFDIFPRDNISSNPLWDPEIVVVASNPVGGIGIGVDPVEFVFGRKGPCHGQPNPLASFEHWSAIPGFDSHHDDRSGTYRTDCEGGGPICFAVNGAIDPAPGTFDIFGLYDLVAHEFGHCLTIGHVGDALDHTTPNVPVHDIMAYTDQTHDKCVSTLDVESFAITMSRFLLDTPYGANDYPFHVQHPDDHWYASPTGAPEDCPQPDYDLVPVPQDDAGSGRDAPNGGSASPTIRPDIAYNGTSHGFLVDTFDTYLFTGAAGQTFQGMSEGNLGCYYVMDADGASLESACSYAHLPFNSGPIVLDLPYTGDYYLRISHLAPSVYRFGFSLEGEAPAVGLLDG
ncbi:MAG: hypothetical protein KY455_03000 [Euryarchaeota archaeon]|nr:hypothetical protein [Euryarchaeota archaeon]